MSTHFTHDEFVLSYYGEPELGAGRRAHLERCEDCLAELGKLAAVLDNVTPFEVPEPDAGYEARVWDRLQWRLRGERRRARHTWVKWVGVAAAIVIAYVTGVLWKPGIARAPEHGTPVIPLAQTVSQQQQQQGDRVLLVIVGEHIDQSERVLVELTNLTPGATTDITTERDRAEELLVSNRLYRRTAVERGEESVATLLDELEPVLLQIAHAPSQVGAEELRAIQKRVESKGLVFKLRVVRADVHRTAGTSASTDI